MARLTKLQIRDHDRACDLIFGSDKLLSFDEVEFVLERWSPMANHNVGKTATFFTPLGLAWEMVILGTPTSAKGMRIVDMCAGTGRITWQLLNRYRFDPASETPEIFAVELNEDFLKIGQRLMPEVTWVSGNVLDQELWQKLPKFDLAVSNPPFGKILTSQEVDTFWLTYRGPLDLMIAEVALRVCSSGATMILPQGSVPSKYWMNRRNYTGGNSREYTKFMNALPGVEMSSLSLDISAYSGQWHGVKKPNIEIVEIYSQDKNL